MKLENEKKINEILCEMTLEEKVAMCHANSKFYSNGVERLCIDELAMMDGPHGVRSEPERHTWACLNREEDKCTYLPTETALAATFIPNLAKRFGETLGSEARYRGKDIILGPGVNIIRTPLCGRNFEYMSEDPCLISKMAPRLVEGIESQDVAACVKHYALNNQELDRSGTNPIVSKRALNEIYLKGFKSAIIDGGASSVMGAYNKHQGQHLCHNKYLVNDILKGEWGFKGVYLTDWAGCHDTDEAIFNGLDIEMGTNKPYNEYYLADAFLEKARQSEEVRQLLEDKVRRILRLMFSINKLNKNRKKGELNTPEHQRTAYDIAAEGMVLLKNDNAVLPIRQKKNKKIIVLGPNADKVHSEGGSSSGVRTVYEITPLEGIKTKLSGNYEIEYVQENSSVNHHKIPTQLLEIIEPKAGVRAVKQVSYKKQDNGEITVSTDYCNNTDLVVNNAEKYDLSFKVNIPEDGVIGFKVNASIGYSVKINGKTYLEVPFGKWSAENCFLWAREFSVEFKKGEIADVEIHIDSQGFNALFDFGWVTPSEAMHIGVDENELLEKAKNADYVIYCGGLDHSFDTEGVDRQNMNLPLEQNVTISKLAAVNPDTVVVITEGSPVEMPWIGEVNSVVWTWYAGMEGGNALADILCGKIVPSGKMPFTLPYKYEDSPVARYGEYKAGDCRYNEDIFVGYRGFEYDNIKPMFPFGHGLSYSDFEYSLLTVSTTENEVKISCKIKNIGEFKACETVQLYIGDVECSVKRPIKELIDFKKIELAVGETKEVKFSVNKEQLSFYDETTDDWKFESGEFKVFIGSSLSDIRLENSFCL